MERPLTPTAPPMDMMEEINIVPQNTAENPNFLQQDPPSYEEAIAQTKPYCCTYMEDPPAYELKSTPPPAESDDETSSRCSSCQDCSDTDVDNGTPGLTKRQKRFKLGFKVASYTVGLPFKLLYEATRSHDPYHEDNDKSHFCSSLAKKTDKLLFGKS